MKAMRAMSLGLAVAVLFAGTVMAEDVEEKSQKYFELIANGKDDDAKKLGEEILKDAATDADALNNFAWKILTEEGLKKRDLELATRVAKTANDLTEGKNAPILDTYARAFFESGKIDEAITLQKKALEFCDDENLKTELEATLKQYEAKKAEKK